MTVRSCDMLRQLFVRGVLACLLILLQCQNGYAITFFEGSLQQAHQKSKLDHKKLLIYFTAKWCGPCRYMEKNVFPVDSVTRITDQQFIALKVDFDAWHAKALLEKYRVASLPSFLILDSLETVERRALGRATVSEFIHFLSPTPVARTVRPVFELRSDEQRYTRRQVEEAKWKLELGFQAGVNVTYVSNLAPSHKLGYDLSLLLSWTKHRMSIRPGLSLVSIGGKLNDTQSLPLQYLSLPVNLSYLLRRTVLFGLPGGYRANLTPYMSKLLNSPSQPVSPWDYGTKLGLSTYIGDTSRLEAQLGYQLGVKDIGGPANAGLYNRGLYFCVALVL